MITNTISSKIFQTVLFSEQGDTVRVIWAMHDKDPHRGAEMVYHENKRGSQSLHLLGPPSPSGGDPAEQVRTWDVSLKDVSGGT